MSAIHIHTYLHSYLSLYLHISTLVFFLVSFALLFSLLHGYFYCSLQSTSLAFKTFRRWNLAHMYMHLLSCRLFFFCSGTHWCVRMFVNRTVFTRFMQTKLTHFSLPLSTNSRHQQNPTLVIESCGIDTKRPIWSCLSCANDDVLINK